MEEQRASGDGGDSGIVCIERWGCVEYSSAVARMEELATGVAVGSAAPAVLLLEHPPVITLGLRGDAATDLRSSAEALAAAGVQVAKTDRGGQATLHSPGQVVAWPVARLRRGRRTLPDFVAAIERAVVSTLAELGIAAEASRRDVGLWVVEDGRRTRRKIASIGLRYHRDVTTHGVALNVANDLSLFDLLVPCGLANASITSVAAELQGRSDSAAGGQTREANDALVQRVGESLAQHLARELAPLVIPPNT